MPRSLAEDPPERRCIVTGERSDPAGLLRFVAGPEGQVVPDMDGDLPGRGLWVTARRSVVAEAVRRNAFSRAAREKLAAPADLPDLVAALLRRRALSRLGLAQRGGAVVAGADKVRDWIVKGRAGVLVQASDGAADGRRRLAHLAQALPLVALYAGQELSLALGRENVVHAAIAAGGAAKRALQDAQRLSSYREQGEAGAALLAGTGSGIRWPADAVPDPEAGVTEQAAAAAGGSVPDR
ncbi:MAG: RNA-binding protein [Sneathiellaceae bacterium]